MIYLESERLYLRAFKPEDALDLFDYLSCPEVVKFEPYEVFDLDSCEKEAVRRASDRAFWAVCLKDNGKLIGNLYFKQQDPIEFSTWELGYVFNPRYGGLGYASEACAKILEHGFTSLDAHRIVAFCNPDNTSSWKLLERLRMRREGHFRKQVFFKRSTLNEPLWWDTYQYALLQEEYINPSS